MNTTEQSKHDLISVDEWNDELSTRLLPDSVILMVYLVVGVLGNSAVLYIHTFRLKGITDDRFFIPALAFVDFMTGTIGTSSCLAVNILPVKFYSDEACKICTFLIMVSTIASISLLLVIAGNRYMKICKPFKRQITAQWIRVSLILVAFSSLLLSWPSVLFYGSKEIIDDRAEGVGYRCTSVRGPWSPTVPLVYKAVILVFIVVISFSLVVLFSLIYIKVFKQMNISITLHPVSSSACSQHCENKANAKEVAVSVENRRHTRKNVTQRLEVRLARIFMHISLVLVICFISKIALMLYESQMENFWVELDNTEIGGYRFLYHLYYVNSIANPIIYGFFDRRFRREVLVVLRLCVGRNSK